MMPKHLSGTNESIFNRLKNVNNRSQDTILSLFLVYVLKTPQTCRHVCKKKFKKMKPHIRIIPLFRC